MLHKRRKTQVIKMGIVFVTASNKTEARFIVEHLLNQRLIACANLMEGVESHFWWQNKIDQSQEVLIFMKARLDMFEQIVKEVKARHSYQVPEIIMVKADHIEPQYAKWLLTETKV